MNSLNRVLMAVLTVVLLSVPFSRIKAQGGIDELLQGGLNDANKLTQGYLSPLMEALGVGLANGWYNTAKPHKPAGFDLTLSINTVRIPDSRRFYDVAALNLQNLQPQFNGDAPTFFGPNETPTYALQDPNDPNNSVTISGPPGVALKDNIGIAALPVPTINLGIGIVKNTDIRVRYLPPINLEDVSIRMWGVGILHDVKQHIPGIKQLPFDLSGFIGYTKSTTDIDLSGAVSGNNQEANIGFSALTVQGLVSKKVAVLTGYAGLGFNVVKSNFDMTGTYVTNAGTFTDPLSIEASASGPRMTLGARLQLAILTLHADYTLQQFNTLTVGLGFSVR